MVKKLMLKLILIQIKRVGLNLKTKYLNEVACSCKLKLLLEKKDLDFKRFVSKIINNTKEKPFSISDVSVSVQVDP